MASSKKKKSPKKPAAKAKNKAAPAKKTAKKAAAPKKSKAKAKPAPKKKKKAAAKPVATKAAAKAAPKKAASKKSAPMAGDSWGNAALVPKVAANTPSSKMTEPSDNPVHALHDLEGELVSPVDEQEQLAERIHGGEEAVKNEDADDEGSPRLDDREDDE